MARKRKTHLNQPYLRNQTPQTKSAPPKQVLTITEIQTLLQQPDLSTPEGIRDRAILETFYCTAIRRKELSGLTIQDIDFTRQTLHIQNGKNCKDRYVPLNNQTLDWLELYIDKVRPLFLKAPINTLFLIRGGRSFALSCLSHLVTKYIKLTQIPKSGSCHLLRHSAATHLLEQGVDLRFIQEFLGHRNINSTEIYTKVSIQKLKEVHEKTHPAKLYPTKTQEILAELSSFDSP